jgi:hypothetical protein
MIHLFGNKSFAPPVDPLHPVNDLGAFNWLDASIPNFLSQTPSPTFTAITANNQTCAWWYCQSPQHRHVGQDSGTREPTWKSSFLNGLGVLQFDGTADYLLSLVPNTELNNKSITFFILMKNNYVTNNTPVPLRFRYDTGEGGDDQLTGIYCYNASAYPHARQSDGTIEAIGASVPLNTWTSLMCEWNINTDTIKVYKNMNYVGQNTNCTASTSVHVATYVGFSYAGAAANYFKGEIAEIVVWDKVLTDAQKAGFALWIQNKWGVGGA